METKPSGIGETGRRPFPKRDEDSGTQLMSSRLVWWLAGWTTGRSRSNRVPVGRSAACELRASVLGATHMGRTHTRTHVPLPMPIRAGPSLSAGLRVRPWPPSPSKCGPWGRAKDPHRRLTEPASPPRLPPPIRSA